MSHAPHALDVRQQILDTAQIIIGGKGFSAVGLTEILAAAKVPKGSFYHYFGSKEAFGEALLERYFARYLAELDALLNQPAATGAERLMAYWHQWIHNYESRDPQGKCLAVKLGAEVADLSEAMRGALERGTGEIIRRLARTIDAARADGSLTITGTSEDMAESLYQQWLGASLRAKISRNGQPLTIALAATKQVLGLL